MSGIVLGEVTGDVCPLCKEELNLEGEFFEGSEVECVCGALLVVGDIEAAYTVTMDVLSPPTQPEKEKP